MEPLCESAGDLASSLDGLACFVTESEPLRLAEELLGATHGTVRLSEALVNRGSLGQRNVRVFVVDDPATRLTPENVVRVVGALRDVVDEADRDYIRIEHHPSDVIAFADYATDSYVFADRRSDDIVDFERPEPTPPSWRGCMDELIDLASRPAGPRPRWTPQAAVSLPSASLSSPPPLRPLEHLLERSDGDDQAAPEA